MTAPSAMIPNDNNDLFPSLEQESHSVLLELYNNPDKLYEYFAEQPSTKQLQQENAQLQQSNLEQAEWNIHMKEKVEQLHEELQNSIDELEAAKDELKTMALLVDEEAERQSYSFVMQSLSSELAKAELELSQYKETAVSKETLNYTECAQVMLKLYQRIHDLRFAKEWIETNHGE